MRVRLLLRQYYKVTYYIGNMRIYFIQEYREQMQLFTNIFTGPAQESPFVKKEVIGTLANLQNGQI